MHREVGRAKDLSAARYMPLLILLSQVKQVLMFLKNIRHFKTVPLGTSSKILYIFLLIAPFHLAFQ